MAKQNKRKAESETTEQPKAKSVKEAPKEVAEEPTEEKTPTQIFFDRLKEVMDRVKAVGYVAEAGEDEDEDDEGFAELLLGAEGDEDDEENEEDDGEEGAGEEGEGAKDEEDGEGEDEPDGEAEDEEGEEEGEGESDDEDEDDIVLGDGRDYTEEELAELRFVLLTERRAAAMEKMSTHLIGEDEDEVVFNTAFSNKIFSEVPKVVKKILKIKKDGEKFDELFGLTKIVSNFDSWVNDYDDAAALAAMLKELGAAWKTVLAKSDKDLEIDAEFTRPGAEKMLENFAELVAQNEENPAFVWK